MHWISLIGFILLIGLCQAQTSSTENPKPAEPIVVSETTTTTSASTSTSTSTSTADAVKPVESVTVAAKTIDNGGNPLDYARIFPFFIVILISFVHL